MKRFVPSFLHPVLILSLFITVTTLPCVQAQTSLATLLQKGEVSIGVINDRHYYHVNADGPQGLDYAYASGYADYLGVTLNIVPFYAESELLNALRKHDIDIAAPRFNWQTNDNAFSSGPLLFTSPLVTVMRGETATPCINLTATQRPVLPALIDAVTAQSGLTWQPADTPDSVGLLNMLASQQPSCSALPAVWLSSLLPRFSDLQVLELNQTELTKQWAVREQDKALLSSLFEYTHFSRANGSLAILMARMNAPRPLLAEPDARTFVTAVEEQYPRIQDSLEAIKSAGNEPYIAAIDYLLHDWQTAPESAGDFIPAATRFEQISRTLERLDQLLPARISAPDRRWFILAAYAIGMEHIEDARQLTGQAGANPDRWIDVKQHLPELSEEYAMTRYGFADGHYAVAFVTQVRAYADTLSLLLKGT